MKAVQTGPFRQRFYASPTSTGGAATEFHFGEEVYMVRTIENASGQDLACHFEIDWKLVDDCPPATHIVSNGERVIWSNEPVGLRACGWSTIESYHGSFTVPADFVERSVVRVDLRPVPKGHLALSWQIGLEFADTLTSKKLGLDSADPDTVAWLCGYPSEHTEATLRIEVR